MEEENVIGTQGMHSHEWEAGQAVFYVICHYTFVCHAAPRLYDFPLSL